MQIQFEKIKSLSELSKGKFAVDIVAEMTGLVQVYSIEKYGLLSTIQVFSTHYYIQTEITKSKAVEGYKELLDALQKQIQNQDFEIYQINIVTENCGYILFTDLNVKYLFGILKMNTQRIVRKVELNERNELRGTWGDRKFYLNGIELN